MGTSNTEVKVKVDTTRDWLAVKTDACTDCNSFKYDAASSSFVDGTVLTSKIDDKVFSGKKATDKVSLASDGTTTVASYTYFAVEGWEGLTSGGDPTNYAGILGLSRAV